jgi:AcrR family transcriptional regulator
MTSSSTPARERVLEAALRLFADRGYERTSIPDIQEAAGLSRGSGALYKHFPSKEALLAAIVDRYIEASDAARSAIADIDLPPAEGLEAIGRGMLDLMSSRRRELRIFWRDLEQFPELQRRVRRKVMQATYSGVAAWIERESAKGTIRVEDARATAAVLVGSLAMFRAFEALWGEKGIRVADAAFLSTWLRIAEEALGLGAEPRHRKRRAKAR